MASAGVYINNRPLEDYGMTVEVMSGWVAPSAFVMEALRLIGRPGMYPSAPTATFETRALEVRGHLTAQASIAARRTALAAFWQALSGELEVRTTDDPNRVSYCYAMSGEGDVFGPQFVNTFASFTLRLVAFDPWFYQLVPTVVPLPAGTRVDLPLGSAPCRGIITLNGANSTLGVRLRHVGGDELGKMELTGTLAAGDILVLDGIAFTATKTTAAGAVSNVLSTLAAGQTFLTFDPMDAPTLEVLGTGDGMVAYRKAEVV